MNKSKVGGLGGKPLWARVPVGVAHLEDDSIVSFDCNAMERFFGAWRGSAIAI